MVDIVYRADAVVKVEVQRYRRDDVVYRDMFMVEFVESEFDVLLLLRREFFGNFPAENIE